MIIAKYKFNPSIYSDLLPKCNSSFTSYTTSDTTNSDGTITRTIESDSLPTRIKFGYRDDSTNTEVAASSLLEVIELNTDNVNTTRDMFRYCSNLISVNATNWNMSNVTDMGSMFSKCKVLTSLDVSNWNTNNVTDMGSMFSNCSSLTSLDLSNFNTSKVTAMYYIFENCESLSSLTVSNWDVSNATDMEGMFTGCSLLTSLDISNWNTSKVTKMNYMFTNCTSLSSLNISSWNTSKVTTMGYLFHNCPKLTSLDLNNWDTSKVTEFFDMFDKCTSLTSLNISNWDTSSADDMGRMFQECRTLTSLDVSNWDTSNATEMNYMFNCCESLTSLDVSNWNISQVTDIHNMFSRCEALTSLDLSNWDTSNVTDMRYLFEACPLLTQINLSNWNTNKVTTMKWMFYDCTNLVSLDISNFNTDNVGSTEDMFGYCSSLRKVALRYANQSTLSKIHENLRDRTSKTKGYILSPISLTLGKNWETLKFSHNEFYLPQPLRKVGDVKDRLYWDYDKGHYCIEQNINDSLEVLETPIIIDLTEMNKKFSFDTYLPNTSVKVTNLPIQPYSLLLKDDTVRYKATIEPSTLYTIQFNCLAKSTTNLTLDLGGTRVTVDPIIGVNHVQITTPSVLASDRLFLIGTGIIVNEVIVSKGDMSQYTKYFDGEQSVGELQDDGSYIIRISTDNHTNLWEGDL